MKTFIPRTASEALSIALRAERARQIIAEGYSFFADAEIDSVAVCKPGSLAAVYWITDKGQTCDCPDGAKGKGPCKHVLAYQIVKEEGIETLAASDVEMVKAFCKERDYSREIEAAMEANQLEMLRQMDEDYANCEGIYPYA